MHRLARGVLLAMLVASAACATVSDAAPADQRAIAAPPSAPDEPQQAASGPDPEPPAEEPPPEGQEPSEEGMASYYADMLSGNATASGERYRLHKRTCAHRTHSFGTVLEIERIAEAGEDGSGITTRCRVNDRGPFARGRILDVSKKVARELGMVAAGVVRVRIKQSPDSSDPG